MLPSVDVLAKFFHSLSASKSFPCGFVYLAETKTPRLVSTLTSLLIQLQVKF